MRVCVSRAQTALNRNELHVQWFQMARTLTHTLKQAMHCLAAICTCTVMSFKAKQIAAPMTMRFLDYFYV